MRTILLMLIFIICFHLGFSQRLEKVWSTKADFRLPESALYNEDHEIIYVTNIGEKQNQKNGDGFISLLTTSGEIENLYWVKGLNDPKGIALKGNNIYVADINEVVVINIESGKIEKKIPFPKSKYLNDVTSGVNGQLFISDMNDQTIYCIDRENISTFKSDSLLKNVNGLFASNGFLYAGNASIWEIEITTSQMKEIFSDTGAIDGLVKIDNDTFIFSNWIGKIFLAKDGTVIQLLDSSDKNQNTADVSYLNEMNILLVPTFSGNTVDAYRLLKE